MKKSFYRKWVYINFWRILPCYFFLRANRMKKESAMDLQEWIAWKLPDDHRGELWKFGHIIVMFKEYRNVFQKRLSYNPVMRVISAILFRKLDSLYINIEAKKMGGGFLIQHGFATIITANSIGERCKVFQQVTIGYNEDKKPTIGDDCTFTAGCIVIGDVHIGDDVMIGAGAVVTRDIPNHAVAAGVPARVIKYREPNAQ